MKRGIFAGGVLLAAVGIASVALAAGGRPPEATTYMNDSTLEITVFTHEEADANDEAKAMDLSYEAVCQMVPDQTMTVDSIEIDGDGTFKFKGSPDAGIGTVKFEGKFVSNRKVKATLVERAPVDCFRKTETTLTKLGSPS